MDLGLPDGGVGGWAGAVAGGRDVQAGAVAGLGGPGEEVADLPGAGSGGQVGVHVALVDAVQCGLLCGQPGEERGRGLDVGAGGGGVGAGCGGVVGAAA